MTVIDIELRMLTVMHGESVVGQRLQMRKLHVLYQDGPMRHAEWSYWEDVPWAIEQTASLAAQQRMREDRPPKEGEHG